MKVDLNEIFQNYNYNETVKQIENLRNTITSKEDSIKEFLRKKSSNVINNTIKIKNIYSSVYNIKDNLDNIITSYEDLIYDVKNTTAVNFKEVSSSSYKKKLSHFEQTVVKDVWNKKYESYEFLFQNSFFDLLNNEENNYYDFMKKNKEELVNYDCFYLNNYTNNIYFDINKKVSEEDYIYVLNKIYTDIFICLKFLNSLFKNQTIRDIYIKIFNNKNSVKYLNSYIYKHKENFSNIILKLIYSSYYNLTYITSSKIKLITKSLIVLLIYCNEKNAHTNEIIKGDIFENILENRMNLIYNLIGQNKEENYNSKNIVNANDDNKSYHPYHNVSFESLKNNFKKATYLLLNTKYTLMLLARFDTQKIHKILNEEIVYDSVKNVINYNVQTSYSNDEDNMAFPTEMKNKSNLMEINQNFENNENNKFIQLMKNDLFILQDIFFQNNNDNRQTNQVNKIKSYYNHAINNIDEINNIINKNDVSKFKLLYKRYTECAVDIYRYMIKILHDYYYKNKYSCIYENLFTKYEDIKMFQKKLRQAILIRENYFNKYINDVDIYIYYNNNLNFIHDRIFETYIFLFLNKFICAIPFFDSKDINKWKIVILKFLKNLFHNISLSYHNNYIIQDYIFYSFLLNSFYFFYQFYNNNDLECVYSKFYQIEKYSNEANKIKESNDMGLSQYFLTNKNVLKEKIFHTKFKELIKEKINPIIYSAYKLIIFIENKEMIKNCNDTNFLFINADQNKVNFFDIFNSFVNLLNVPTESQFNWKNQIDHDDKKNEDIYLDKLNKFDLLDSFLKFNYGISKNVNLPKNENCEDISKNKNFHISDNITLNDNTDINNYENMGNNFNISDQATTKQIEIKEKLNEKEYAELYFFMNLFKYNNKKSFNAFLDCPKDKNNKDRNNMYSKILKEEERNFLVTDIKSIYFSLVYKMFKIILKCLCIEYFANLKKYLYSYIPILFNNDIKNIICEKVNCHLVNIFMFSNILILYIEKIMNTNMYRDIIIFIIKLLLQKKIFFIYYIFIENIKKMYASSIGKVSQDGYSKNILDKKITGLYNIILLDLSFADKILDKNAIVNKSLYENLISRYRRYKKYYIKSCLYFIDIYKEKYNAYSDKKISSNNITENSNFFYKKINKEYADNENKANYNNGTSNSLLKMIIDNVLVELNKFDNLSNIIFQKHILSLSQGMIKNTYFLYYLFVHDSIINNIFIDVLEPKNPSIEIFTFNQVLAIDHCFIEEKLLDFFF
ncbi:conserved Plasmodium protein, unknown function [Plasmodium berghei]|uniref:Uncharacterized protein n=2 Tax=Plasmodium berghei TaxID=5821 RepID=A0A509AQM9_PLABA|nr:conserved Plasmodium protein, unknown function [Plasmodium berghei ANKA]CXI94531.1 conserved Plasmodium protein, unknown function [Plasmodium berghei]SCL97014.1 conserved Plasmodium protein, unknown function [Plasmodium berghei]SCM16533.1 conserved Plasmodium protein, unknown function [Plasmodium berghei]SCM18327.1 conserved Plasmodium protein, unknown function [Plasmodium berghei]SCN27757.1 conserved Plasmodium protein, unknown function [Plasmodium berghei]|eukprot:XP_034423410.1 conserved Plasmodium protein, unknown function [Plasmodium berghei ANKA]